MTSAPLVPSDSVTSCEPLMIFAPLAIPVAEIVELAIALAVMTPIAGEPKPAIVCEAKTVEPSKICNVPEPHKVPAAVAIELRAAAFNDGMCYPLVAVKSAPVACYTSV